MRPETGCHLLTLRDIRILLLNASRRQPRQRAPGLHLAGAFDDSLGHALGDGRPGGFGSPAIQMLSGALDGRVSVSLRRRGALPAGNCVT